MPDGHPPEHQSVGSSFCNSRARLPRQVFRRWRISSRVSYAGIDHDTRWQRHVRSTSSLCTSFGRDSEIALPFSDHVSSLGSGCDCMRLLRRIEALGHHPRIAEDRDMHSGCGCLRHHRTELVAMPSISVSQLVRSQDHRLEHVKPQTPPTFSNFPGNGILIFTPAPVAGRPGRPALLVMGNTPGMF